MLAWTKQNTMQRAMRTVLEWYTTFKPFGQDFLLYHKIEEKKIVPNSENPKVIFSLFETVKLSVSISPRNLYISLRSIKENRKKSRIIIIIIIIIYLFIFFFLF